MISDTSVLFYEFLFAYKKKEQGIEAIKNENRKLRVELAQQLRCNLYSLAIKYLGDIKENRHFLQPKSLDVEKT